jgi:hypothetical protein
VLTYRADILLQFNSNLQLSIAANAKPRSSVKSLNASFYAGMIQLIPSRAYDTLPFFLDLHNIAVLVKAPPCSTLKTFAPAAISESTFGKTMATSTLGIAAQNVAQNMKVGAPVPSTGVENAL